MAHVHPAPAPYCFSRYDEDASTEPSVGRSFLRDERTGISPSRSVSSNAEIVALMLNTSPPYESRVRKGIEPLGVTVAGNWVSFTKTRRLADIIDIKALCGHESAWALGDWVGMLTTVADVWHEASQPS